MTHFEILLLLFVLGYIAGVLSSLRNYLMTHEYGNKNNS